MRRRIEDDRIDGANARLDRKNSIPPEAGGTKESLKSSFFIRALQRSMYLFLIERLSNSSLETGRELASSRVFDSFSVVFDFCIHVV